MSKWNQRAQRKREKVRRGVEGGERRVVEEAMKRPRDKKKEGEGRNDGREMDEKGEETKREGERERDRVGIERGEQREE